MPYGQITTPNTTLAHLHTNAVGAGGALDADVTLVDTETLETEILTLG